VNPSQLGFLDGVKQAVSLLPIGEALAARPEMERDLNLPNARD
jgi:hypothetical protein